MYLYGTEIVMYSLGCFRYPGLKSKHYFKLIDIALLINEQKQ